MMSAEDHYYELHITVEARTKQDGSGACLGESCCWDAFKGYVAQNLSSWRVSKFSEDEVDDYHGKWFLSARVKNPDAIRPELTIAVTLLGLFGYVILRWKAEDTLLDSKYGDTL